MQIAVAAIYRKYYTKICSMMNDAMMEVDDGITSARPVVRAPHQISSNHGRATIATWNSMTQKIRNIEITKGSNKIYFQKPSLLLAI
jgi:hypothetical protein